MDKWKNSALEAPVRCREHFRNSGVNRCLQLQNSEDISVMHKLPSETVFFFRTFPIFLLGGVNIFFHLVVPKSPWVNICFTPPATLSALGGGLKMFEILFIFTREMIQIWRTRHIFQKGLLKIKPPTTGREFFGGPRHRSKMQRDKKRSEASTWWNLNHLDGIKVEKLSNGEKYIRGNYRQNCSKEFRFRNWEFAQNSTLIGPRNDFNIFQSVFWKAERLLFI